MEKQEQIKAFINKSEIVKKRWGSVATRTLNSINWIDENTYRKSIEEILNEIYFRVLMHGEEMNRHSTLYIKLKRINIGKSNVYPKLAIMYLCVSKDFLKKKVQRELFPDILVCLDSEKL